MLRKAWFKAALMATKALALICTLLSLPSFSEDYSNCFNRASLHYQVPTALLKAIAVVESKMQAKAIHFNQNGTYDIGIMQINSIWLSKLS